MGSGVNPSFVTYRLRDLGQLTLLSCACFSIRKTGIKTRPTGQTAVRSQRTWEALTALGLNSSLWKKPPVIIFLLKVITSAGSSRPQCSWAQNLPVQPPPVWTSSTKKAQPCWPQTGAGRSQHLPRPAAPTPVTHHRTQNPATAPAGSAAEQTRVLGL